MVKPITKYITDDGLIFNTLESAEQSEHDHANFKLYIRLKATNVIPYGFH